MKTHPSRLRKNLFVSVVTSIVLMSTSAHAEKIVWTCFNEDFNLKALLTQNESSAPTVCSILVTRTYRKKVTSRITWRALNEIGFCQTKFNNKLAELKGKNWQCTEPENLTEDSKALLAEKTKSDTNKVQSGQPATVPTALPESNNPAPKSSYVRHYSLIPYVNFAKYEGEDSVGSKATIVSRSADPGLMLSAGIASAGNWDISGLVGVSYTDLKINSNVDTLDNEKQFLGDVSVEAAHALTDSLSGVLSGGAEKLLFVNRDATTGKLSIEGLIVPEVTLGLQWQAYVGESLTWSPTIAAGYLFRTSNDKVEAKDGSVYTLGLQVSRNSGFNPIVGGLYFQQRQQDTSLVKWTHSDVGLWFAWAL